MKKRKNMAIKGLTSLALAWTVSCFIPSQNSAVKEDYSKNSNKDYTDSLFSLTPDFIESPIKPAIEIDTTIILSKKEISDLVSKAYNKIKLRKRIPEYISKKFFEDAVLTESSGKIYAESDIGARGLLQLMQDAWEQIEQEDSLKYGDPIKPYSLAFDPQTNIENGISYYLWVNGFCAKNHPNWAKLSSKQKIDILHAGYNCGAPSLRDLGWNIGITPPETRTHVIKLDSLASS